nr:MAG TPA_asm: Putative Holin-like Toxin (Hol-Tox) [Caudoviricetes sp.]
MLSLDLDTLPERSDIMSTYEELQIILTTALLIVAILTYTHKK